MSTKHPIGVFDSGLGGLTILKQIVYALPEYDYIYLGDNARAPYGPRNFETVYQYTLEAVKWLFDQGCPLVILACNTASAKALRTIQQKDLQILDPEKRVLGIIRPTTEVIGSYTKTGGIGILGTQGTVDSGSYLIEIAKFFSDVMVYQQACPTWVPLVEKGAYTSDAANTVVKECLDKLLKQSPDIDTILLACTHYPLLMDIIQANLPLGIQVIEQGRIVADSLKVYLEKHVEIEAILSKAEFTNSILFYTTGDSSSFAEKATSFWGNRIDAKTISLL
jgi:glutamate racemase